MGPSAIPKAELPGEMPDHEGFRTYFLRFPHSKAMVEGHAVVPPRAFTTEEIEEEIETYVESAKLAATAGFDGIEITHATATCWTSFGLPSPTFAPTYMAAARNRNRVIMEFPQDRCRHGGRFSRSRGRGAASAEEHVEGGYIFADTRDLAVELTDVGVHYFDMTSSRRASFKNFIPDVDGTNMEYAKGIKEATGLPVMCNNLHEPSPFLRASRRVLRHRQRMPAAHRRPRNPEQGQRRQGGRIVRCPSCYACTLD